MRLADLERIAAFGDLFTDKIHGVCMFPAINETLAKSGYTLFDLYLDKTDYRVLFTASKPLNLDKSTVYVGALHDNRLYFSTFGRTPTSSNWTRNYNGIVGYNTSRHTIDVDVLIDKMELPFTINLATFKGVITLIN